MMKYKLKQEFKTQLADTLTPVGIYLKIRDIYPNSILLESSDYHTNDNNISYICFNPIASFKVENESITQTFPDGLTTTKAITKEISVIQELKAFSACFETENSQQTKIITNGLFGYMGYDAVRYFENIQLSKKEGLNQIPDVFYNVYQNIIAFNHFKNEAYFIANSFESESNIDQIIYNLQSKPQTTFEFNTTSEIDTNLDDEAYKDLVKKAKQHCQRGDVFQLVLSKRFTQAFNGDEFNVYRALRNINPSPYLFYFDYGQFKLFGSSPEAQLVVNKQQAEIHPIAGTFKRTGNDIEDAQLAQKLLKDEKENSEHMMLVDLARNDLSKHGKDVTVERFKEVQFFSHVIHLVSKVVANVGNQSETLQMASDTFPAGTLSGAPKHMAMQLIQKYEPTSREYYGGAIGMIDFEGNFNHAIMIRTFLSKDYKLTWQAGAGLVAKSDPESELQEVYNKLNALVKAIEQAKNIK